MVRFVMQEVAESPLQPLQVYNRLRILTRDFLLSQVSRNMRAPRKTGRRMKPGTKGEGERPPVCRRLFSDELVPEEEGLVDNMMNRITEQIERNLTAACEKYNFDFRNEVPLEGDWTWERITPEGEVSEMIPQGCQETPQKLPAPEAPKSEPPAAEPPTPLQLPSVPQ